MSPDQVGRWLDRTDALLSAAAGLGIGFALCLYALWILLGAP